ncbi:MAG: hypothetical protein Ct9H300mP23_04460 [Nitrospinota bacterium]|nr:MAG: hypothetical protein Ct9H300mP23_04460 [Nitrospinota bacterium]
MTKTRRYFRRSRKNRRPRQAPRALEEISQTSLCGLGETAPKAILTGLKYFRKEYERHIVDKFVMQHVVRAFIAIVKEEDCVACGA